MIVCAVASSQLSLRITRRCVDEIWVVVAEHVWILWRKDLLPCDDCKSMAASKTEFSPLHFLDSRILAVREWANKREAGSNIVTYSADCRLTGLCVQRQNYSMIVLVFVINERKILVIETT